MRNLRKASGFWIRNMLENLGLVFLISFALLLFLGMKASPVQSGGWGNLIFSTLRQYPYYFLVTGGFLMVVSVMGYFRTYVPLLVSFNCRRKTVVLGMMASITGTVLMMSAAAVLIWKWLPGESEAYDLTSLPLMAGGIFLEIGLALFLGGIISKWGKLGMILFTILTIICSAGFGLFCAIGGTEKLMSYIQAAEMPWIILGIGICCFLAAGAFCIAVTKKLEVRL